MIYISHFRFQPDMTEPRLEQLTLNEYQATRSHPARPIKNRSTMDFPPVELIKYRLNSGEKLKHGVPSKGAKVRIFHVFPRNATSQHELRAYIQKLQQFGLTVKAAMHGGETTSPKSLAQASNLSALFSRMNVQVVFDETCEKREANKPLGVLIHANHAVQFVTELAQR
jgi:hypothetical protein